MNKPPVFTFITNPKAFMVHPTWEEIEPYFRELSNHTLTSASVYPWLAAWSELSRLVDETYRRLYVAITTNTEDTASKERYHAYLDHIYPVAQSAFQIIKEKLLDSSLLPAGMDIPLRNFRAEAAIFREANLPLLGQELKLSAEYDQIIGAQTVMWEGSEKTIAQLEPIYQSLDRQRREKAWRLASDRQLADRQALNELWVRLLDTRLKVAANANLPDYRAYRWLAALRFDYTPKNCQQFHEAIEQVVVPVAGRIYEKRRQRLGVSSLRPWDLKVDPFGREALHPFTQISELEDKTSAIFERIDPQFSRYFNLMSSEGLLDLSNRKGKAGGGYCTNFDFSRRPFIFMNSVGLHEDVQTLLHEGGHAFHVFEADHLPYHSQTQVSMEFAEVASTSIEMLAAPYLASEEGGFYTKPDAERAFSEFLVDALLFWPYMAVVDAFQHWVYENPDKARDPSNCDDCWAELWKRFTKGVDWSGLDATMITGWQRKLHIFQAPFYYIEYGLASLGACQVWRKSLKNPTGAVAAYRRALSLGGTASIPQLYAAAGAKFAFDAAILQEIVSLLEARIEELEAS